ncbi:MAG: hypothetical protein AB7K64_17270 [Variibacter sp.]
MKKLSNKLSCAGLGLTLDEALSDPLVRAVSRADGIDPESFESFLRRAAGKLAQRAQASAPFAPAEAAACL